MYIRRHGDILDGMPVALITGGAKRVGRAIVHRLCDGGFDIAFTYLNSVADADSLVAEITSKGRKATAIKADLTEPALAVAQITKVWKEAFGRLDLLVNSASLYEPGTLAQTDSAQIRRAYAIHVESPILLCQALAGALRAANGRVINMVDIQAEKPVPQYLAYCASKAALLNLTLNLARELAPQVTVNGIAPGTVEWPDGFPQAKREKYLHRVPLGRAGTPQDVAELVYFLATAGSYITGQIIHLDGGRSIT
jgi:pteridine reductase